MIEPTENWISTSRIHGWVGHTCHKWNVPWWVWNGLKASRGRRNHDVSGCPSKYRGSNPSAIWVYHVESFKIIRANSEIYGKSEVLTPTNSVVSTISAPWDSPWQSLPRAMCGSIPWRKNLLVLNKRRVAGWVAGVAGITIDGDDMDHSRKFPTFSTSETKLSMPGLARTWDFDSSHSGSTPRQKTVNSDPKRWVDRWSNDWILYRTLFCELG